MKKTILALALAAGLTSFAGSAKAGLTFDWSFHTDKVASGVLTLNDAGTAATSLYVTSPGPNNNYNFVNEGVNGLYSNDFSLSEGKIVAANFISYAPGNDGYVWLNGFGEYNFLYPQGVYDYSGLAGLTFTPVTSGADTAPVPEPSQVAASLLLAAGIAGFVIVKRRQEASELEALAA